MNADQLLATYLHTTTAALGTAMTSTSQLEAYGRALMPGFFRGVFPQGEEPADRRGAYGYIVNTQPAHIATGHSERPERNCGLRRQHVLGQPAPGAPLAVRR